MSRSLDDDAPHRISDADDHLSAEQRQAEADERASLRTLRHDVRQTERDLVRRRRRVRAGGVALTVAGGAMLAGLLWTVLTWGSPSRFLRVDITCAVLTLVSGVPARVAAPPRGQLSLAKLEDMLATNREALRFLSALIHPTLKERRSLYREGVGRRGGGRAASPDLVRHPSVRANWSSSSTMVHSSSTRRFRGARDVTSSTVVGSTSAMGRKTMSGRG